VTSALHSLNPGILETLGRVLSGKRLVAPYSATGLARHVPGVDGTSLAGILLESLTIAQALTRRFESLVQVGVLKRLFA